MASADCPSLETLQGFAAGTLPEAEMLRVATHLADCPECEAKLADVDPSSDSFLEYLREYDESLCCERGYEQLCDRLAGLEESTEPGHGAGASPSGASRARANPPVRLGNYQLYEELGRGAMGAVYRARHLKLNRVVAVKLLAPDRLGDPLVVDRFSREMESLGRIDDHPNVVRARDAGELDGQHYLVMELVDGVDLGRLLRLVTPLRVADACEIIRQAARGLSHAHQTGLLHRDVKPSNLMLTRSGGVQLMDLGLAAARGEQHAGSAVVGTADYMAPEQWLPSAQLDYAVDIYGLGCTFYKLLTGQAPFAEQASTAGAKRLAHKNLTPPSARAARADLPIEVDELLTRMLAKRPSHRPASAALVAAELETHAAEADLSELSRQALGDSDDTSTHAPEPTLAQRILGPLTLAHHTRRRFTATALAAAGLLGGGVWGLKRAFWSSPFELLIAAEPDFVRWEYDPLTGNLQTYTTGTTLLRCEGDSPASYELTSDIEQLDRSVEVGLFVGYCSVRVSEGTRRRFEVIGLGPDQIPNLIRVYRTAYIVTTQTDREIWERHPISTIDVVPHHDNAARRLAVIIREGRLRKVVLDGKKLPELCGPTPAHLALPGERFACGVFSTEGAAYYTQTRLSVL